MPITLVSQAVVESGGPSVNAMSIPAPSGLNASMLDVMLAAIRDSNGNSVMTVGTDGGAYNTIAGTNLNSNGSITADFTLRQKVGAASPGALSVTWTSYGRRYIGLRSAWAGVDLVSPIDAQSVSPATGFFTTEVDPTITIPGITTVTAGAVVMLYVVTSGRGTLSTPSGWTLLYSNLAYDGSATITVSVFYKTQASPGAVGNTGVVHTQGGSDPYYNWAGGMVALKPDLTVQAAIKRVRANFLGM